MKTLNDFSVEVRQGSGPWLPVDVYPVKVDRVDEKGHNVEVASIAYFDFDGMVDCEDAKVRMSLCLQHNPVLSYSLKDVLSHY